jgi:cell division protease FtsH
MLKWIVSISVFFQIISGLSRFPHSNFNRVHNTKRTAFHNRKYYPVSPPFHEEYLRNLNSKNVTQQTDAILGKNKHYKPSNGFSNKNNENKKEEEEDDDEEEFIDIDDDLAELYGLSRNGGLRIIIEQPNYNDLGIGIGFQQGSQNPDNQQPDDRRAQRTKYRGTYPPKSNTKKSDNFEIIESSPYNFTDIGGYDNIKLELEQCIDILSNYTKYEGYNVRIPKGLIFEGPPGNGKTLFAKALAGEAKINFIVVSGAEFMEKYVGTGGMKVRELFKLANDNKPCIIFIDEIDAIGKKRSGDGETSSAERDSTLNELLIALDGFRNSSGVFLIGATNRVDMLDDALIRPGRIDKHIYIGNPDEATRKAILNIHLKGKPHDSTIIVNNLVEMSEGLSGAQLENLLNEAMLNALRFNRIVFNMTDIDVVMNKIMVGWQPNEHKFTSDIIDHIAIHELGHAVVGLLCKHHPNMTKVIINLSAPKSPAYTVFASTPSSISTREALFEHLMILLSGRIAEEVFYGVSVTTGAINDFEEAFKLAQKMIVYYGMGKSVIYPSMSEKYKEMIDNEVAGLIHDAYGYAEFLIRNSKNLIYDGSLILKENKLLTAETLTTLMHEKYESVVNLQTNSNK